MKIVILGAGQSGAWAARAAREVSHDSQIILIGKEDIAPYERPPLSKGVLTDLERTPPCVLSQAQAESLNIDMRLGVQARLIDRIQKQVLLSNGDVLPYDKLALCTGGVARKPKLPGFDLPGVYTIRTLDDALRLRAALLPGKRLLVVGGGWIGLEIAATARQLGLNVTVIEAGSRLSARSVPPEISQFLLLKHRSEGVNVVLNGNVRKICATAHGLSVSTHVGAQIYDLIVFGIGLEPNVELASTCELEVNNGIVVNDVGQTSDPDIYAAGDVANQPCNWPGATPGQRIRLESWANAQNQGQSVGKAMAGEKPSFGDLPWFWSEQYDVNVQVVGLPVSDALTVCRGEITSNSFMLFQFSGLNLQAAIAVNNAKGLKLAKRWIRLRNWPSIQQLADTAFKLEKFKP